METSKIYSVCVGLCTMRTYIPFSRILYSHWARQVTLMLWFTFHFEVDLIACSQFPPLHNGDGLWGWGRGWLKVPGTVLPCHVEVSGWRLRIELLHPFLRTRSDVLQNADRWKPRSQTLRALKGAVRWKVVCTTCESATVTSRVSVSELLLRSSFRRSHLAACAHLNSFPRLQLWPSLLSSGTGGRLHDSPAWSRARAAGLWQVDGLMQLPTYKRNLPGAPLEVIALPPCAPPQWWAPAPSQSSQLLFEPFG